MKILILADIHANWPALLAVAEQEAPFDECFVLGDLVEYGGQPREVLHWVRTHATAVVRGNHDHAIAHQIKPQAAQSALKKLRNETREHHHRTLSQWERKYLGQLPLHWTINREGNRWGLWHASPRDPLYEYMPPSAAGWESCLAWLAHNTVLVGHTHFSYQLTVGQKTVLNPGSVGFPRDGKTGASYAVWENNCYNIRRVQYPIDDVIQSLEQGGISPESCLFARQLLETGKISDSDQYERF